MGVQPDGQRLESEFIGMCKLKSLSKEISIQEVLNNFFFLTTCLFDNTL